MVENCDEIPHQDMKEKYKVSINNEEIKIAAETEWGILRGLETLGKAHFRLVILNFRLFSGLFPVEPNQLNLLYHLHIEEFTFKILMIGLDINIEVF